MRIEFNCDYAMSKITHYPVYEVIYFNRGYHSKRYLSIIDATKAFEKIPCKFSPCLKKYIV